MRKFPKLKIFIATVLFFVVSLNTVKVSYAAVDPPNCPGLTHVPISIDQASGPNGIKTVTVQFSKITQDQFNKDYKDNGANYLLVVDKDDPNNEPISVPPHVISTEWKDVTYGIGPFSVSKNPANLEVFLEPTGPEFFEKQCTLSNLLSFSVTAAVPPKEGERCDNNKQNDPAYKCVSPLSCLPSDQTENGFVVFKCASAVGPSNSPLAQPCPAGQVDDKKGCRRIMTALGPISTQTSAFTRWVLGFVLSIAGGIVVLIIIIAGYRLMTSQGDPEKVKNAREQLTAAIIGLLFIIFSLVILQVITSDILGLPGFGG